MRSLKQIFLIIPVLLASYCSKSDSAQSDLTAASGAPGVSAQVSGDNDDTSGAALELATVQEPINPDDVSYATLESLVLTTVDKGNGQKDLSLVMSPKNNFPNDDQNPLEGNYLEYSLCSETGFCICNNASTASCKDPAKKINQSSRGSEDLPIDPDLSGALSAKGRVCFYPERISKSATKITKAKPRTSEGEENFTSNCGPWYSIPVFYQAPNSLNTSYAMSHLRQNLTNRIADYVAGDIRSSAKIYMDQIKSKGLDPKALPTNEQYIYTIASNYANLPAEQGALFSAGVTLEAMVYQVQKDAAQSSSLNLVDYDTSSDELTYECAETIKTADSTNASDFAHICAALDTAKISLEISGIFTPITTDASTTLTTSCTALATRCTNSIKSCGTAINNALGSSILLSPDLSSDRLAACPAVDSYIAIKGPGNASQCDVIKLWCANNALSVADQGPQCLKALNLDPAATHETICPALIAATTDSTKLSNPFIIKDKATSPVTYSTACQSLYAANSNCDDTYIAKCFTALNLAPATATSTEICTKLKLGLIATKLDPLIAISSTELTHSCQLLRDKTSDSATRGGGDKCPGEPVVAAAASSGMSSNAKIALITSGVFAGAIIIASTLATIGTKDGHFTAFKADPSKSEFVNFGKRALNFLTAISGLGALIYGIKGKAPDITKQINDLDIAKQTASVIELKKVTELMDKAVRLAQIAEATAITNNNDASKKAAGEAEVAAKEAKEAIEAAAKNDGLTNNTKTQIEKLEASAKALEAATTAAKSATGEQAKTLWEGDHKEVISNGTKATETARQAIVTDEKSLTDKQISEKEIKVRDEFAKSRTTKKRVGAFAAFAIFAGAVTVGIMAMNGNLGLTEDTTLSPEAIDFKTQLITASNIVFPMKAERNCFDDEVNRLANDQTPLFAGCLTTVSSCKSGPDSETCLNDFLSKCQAFNSCKVSTLDEMKKFLTVSK